MGTVAVLKPAGTIDVRGQQGTPPSRSPSERMIPDEIRSLIEAGESQTVEFKRSPGQRTEAARTACAMLNGTGGSILFGVEPDSHKSVGQQVGGSTVEDVIHELRRIEPYVPLHPESYGINRVTRVDNLWRLFDSYEQLPYYVY